jgi:hypothetical protein
LNGEVIWYGYNSRKINLFKHHKNPY